MTLSPEIVTRNRSFPLPRVSLIIPVFNQQNKISFSLEKIKQAVESAFSDYELIVVDDGSTDNTLTILRGITSTDPRIRVLYSKPRKGLCGQTWGFTFSGRSGDFLGW
jgi:glycosyltransferase involved in cell wall biosynthesis